LRTCLLSREVRIPGGCKVRGAMRNAFRTPPCIRGPRRTLTRSRDQRDQRATHSNRGERRRRRGGRGSPKRADGRDGRRRPRSDRRGAHGRGWRATRHPKSRPLRGDAELPRPRGRPPARENRVVPSGRLHPPRGAQPVTTDADVRGSSRTRHPARVGTALLSRAGCGIPIPGRGRRSETTAILALFRALRRGAHVCRRALHRHPHGRTAGRWLASTCVEVYAEMP
jgi:hypothetical protein